jgi:hypothetical protein
MVFLVDYQQPDEEIVHDLISCIKDDGLATPAKRTPYSASNGHFAGRRTQ